MLTIDNESHENKSVRLGNGDEMSMKALQNFYAKVTGKKEQLSKSIQINHKTTFEDFENLHAKIQQVCGPLNIVQHNESVVVYHVNESKDQFSSFDSFRRYNKSSVHPVENVHIEYNILLTQPGLQDVQNFKIVIDVHSRAGLLRRAESENGSMSNFIFQMVAKNTGNIKINYVDYIVAINFLIAIEQWFQSLHHEKENRFVKYFKKTSHNFDFIFKYTSVSAFLGVCFLYFRNISYSGEVLLGVAIAVFGFAYVFGGGYLVK